MEPYSKLVDLKVDLCHLCHVEVHYAFLIHLIGCQRFDGYNRLNAIQYTVLKQFLKTNLYKKVWKVWIEHWQKFIDHTVEEFTNDSPPKPLLETDVDGIPNSVIRENISSEFDKFEGGAIDPQCLSDLKERVLSKLTV